MRKWVNRWVLRILRIPEEAPRPEAGELLFRAAPSYFRYTLLKWGLAQAAAIIGLVVGFAVMRNIDVPAMAMTWIRLGEALALVGFVVQLPFTLAAVRLDYAYRWYIVGERSLRIREGLLTLREQTMTLANIQNMGVVQGPLQRLLGISDLQVHTAGGGGKATDEWEGKSSGIHTATFRGVKNAVEIRDTVRQRIRTRRDAGLGDPDDDGQDEPAEQMAVGPPIDPELLASREVLAEVRALRSALAPRRERSVGDA